MIDTVTSYTDDRRIRKGSFLEWSGNADDGVNDTLDEVQIEVVGIVPGQAGAAGFVEIVIDGMKVEDTFPVIDMPVTDTDGTHWEERTIDLDLSNDLDDGDDLAADDEENDGEPGRTTIALHVEDIAEDLASKYRVEVEVTGGTLQRKRELEWPLTEFRYLGESQWRKDETFDLDLDLTDETRPLTVAARVIQVDLGIDVAEHSPNLLLRGKRTDVCSAELTMTGEAHTGTGTIGISLSDTPKPVWYGIFPGEALWVEPTEKYDDILVNRWAYSLQAQIDGIEPGATGTFTRPAEISWSTNPPYPEQAATLHVYGDVIITITEHRAMTEYLGGDEMSEPQTDMVKGTVTGRLKDDGGPDTPGFIDVQLSFAYSKAGCYPDRSPAG